MGLEPQLTTLIKVRQINNFVKGVPLANEGYFPKIRGRAKLSVLLSNLSPCLPVFQAIVHNYDFVQLHNYDFMFLCRSVNVKAMRRKNKKVVRVTYSVANLTRTPLGPTDLL